MENRLSAPSYDVAIIGAGVVGCAMARRFTIEGARVIVLEKAADYLDGASKGNSGIMHSGFDAPPESLEWACVREGIAEFREIKDRLGLPAIESGAIMVAFTEEDAGRLESIREKAIANEVTQVVSLSRDELLRREPNLSPRALAGLWIPDEWVIDPWSTPLAYLQQAVMNGAEVLFRAEVLSGEFDSNGWRLKVPSREISAQTVINCAGNYGDIVDERLLGAANFLIQPRKGQYVVFDKSAYGLINCIILQLPTKMTKGILVARTIFGNLLVGPTAEPQRERDRALPDTKTAKELIAQAIEIVPALAAIAPIVSYAGLRPATDEPEYRIQLQHQRRWITVGGIRSTGLTSALGVAKHVFRLYSSAWPASRQPLVEPVWPYMPQLAEASQRDWQTPGCGDIACACEMVTEREVLAALDGTLPAQDLGGLKRRTRVAIGTCQGERCLPRVQALAGSRLESFEIGLRRPFTDNGHEGKIQP